MPLISVVASKRKTGKTTVVTRPVAELQRAGFSVGVVKSDKHGFQMDHEGTDTDLSYKAGADAVAIAGPNETAIRIRTQEQSNLYEISQFMPVEYSYTRNKVPRYCPYYRGYPRGTYGRANLG